jgi:hypothetical protein
LPPPTSPTFRGLAMGRVSVSGNLRLAAPGGSGPAPGYPAQAYIKTGTTQDSDVG